MVTLLLLISLSDYDEITYYIKIAKQNNLSQRQLQEKIKSKEYNRLSLEVKKQTNQQRKNRNKRSSTKSNTNKK